MSYFFRHKIIFIAILIVLFAVFSQVSYHNEIKVSTREDSRKIQAYITESEKKIKETDLSSLFNAGFETKDSTFINPLENESEITTLVYQKDELTYWSNSNIAFPANAQSLKEGSNLVKLKNYWADIYKIVAPDKTHYILCIIPVKFIYDIRNNYLTNHFAVADIVNDLIVSDKNTTTGQNINNLAGQFLFSLQPSLDSFVLPTNLWLIFLDLLLYLLILFLFHQLAILIEKQTSYWLGIGFLAIILILFRIAFSYFMLLPYLQSTIPFDPKYFASTNFFPSLGIMCLNLSSMLLWVYYVYHHFKFKPIKYRSILMYALIGLLFVGIYLLQFPLFNTIHSLVIDSVISFELNNLFSLDYISFLGFLMIFMMVLIYYFISAKIFQFSIFYIKKDKFVFLAINLVVLLLILSYIYCSNITPNNYLPAIWTFCWILILWYNNTEAAIFPKTFSNIINIAFFSLMIVVYLNSLLTEKSKLNAEVVALKLSDDRDYVAEFSFTDIHCRITDDPYVRNSFTTRGLNHKTVIDRIKLLYFKGYLAKFEIEIHSFDKQGNSIIDNDTLSLRYYKNIIDKYGFETSDLYLRYIQDPTQNFYSSIVPVYSDTSFAGSFVIMLKPRSKDIANVYPELLLSKGVQKTDGIKNGNYVVYNNAKIIKSKGSVLINEVKNISTLQVDSFYWQEQPNNFILSYKPTNSKSIVLTIPKRTLIQNITTYSYLFSLAIIYIILLNLVNILSWLITNLKDNKYKKITIPFHDRISYTLMSLLAFSFFAVAIITTIYFTYQYNEDNMQTISTRSKKIQNEIQDDIRNIDSLTNISMIREKLLYDIPALADNEQLDINIYDKDGNMIVTSQLTIFEKGLLSYKINPIAFRDLLFNNNNQVIQKENIGKLSYISTYVPILNENGQTIGYINIPYFGQTQYLKENISRFIIALVNVYVPLLLITGLLGLFIANSLTKPLAEIGEKLRKVVLGKRNEPIIWKRDDEIGLLVKEYNKMIVKLEDSASNLAKSEREGAWREMAKQIAHEIKNPLTPMKLSIQYLQRAIQEESPDTLELTKRMSDTLIEQIDNLSEIATAFSSFAQMPNANNEVIDLEHYIKSIVDLFNDEQEIKINYRSEIKPAYIFADKNQMISVFNNIIKNATQAKSDDAPCLIEIVISAEKDAIKVVIQDNGNGIPDDIKEKVFVPNFTTKNSGSGLGLAISKQIVENANGQIWFESTVGVGTTFFVTIPKYHLQANPS